MTSALLVIQTFKKQQKALAKLCVINSLSVFKVYGSLAGSAILKELENQKKTPLIEATETSKKNGQVVDIY